MAYKHKLITAMTPRSHSPVKVTLPDDEKIRITFLSIIIFFAGIPSAQNIQLVGELYITELLLPLIAIGVVFLGKSRVFGEKIFWKFFAVCVCMLVGYIVSDIIAGTDSSRYFRAWGRNFVLFTNIVSLAIIFGSDRRLIWWFILGFASGDILDLLIRHVTFADWKLGYGLPVILLTCLLAYKFPKKIVMISMFGLGILSILLDSRSMGLLCLITGSIIFIRLNRPSGLRLRASALFRIVLAGVVVLVLIQNLLELTQAEHGKRHGWSNMGRFAALRISVVAIVESPILGYGSWGQGTEKFAAQYYDDVALDLKKSGQQNLRKGTVFLSHSQILQAWMEGGILGAAFFIFFGYQLVFCLKQIILTRHIDYLTPLYSFLLLNSVWNLIMSPYGGNHRLPIAISVAVICLLHMEKRKTPATRKGVIEQGKRLIN